MKKIYFVFVFLLFFWGAFSQIVINELDSDTEGIDLEEFIELKTDEPYQSLDDYVLVFFNGSEVAGNTSYLTIDLEGYTSDINGIFLIGSTHVSPFPDLLIEPNIIQNGEDAVAIYYGSEDDFPEWTLATTDNLIDALVYGNDDPISEDLLELLGQEEQLNENINNNKDFESIQRNSDGSYFVGSPTPGANNDGSGVSLNGIEVQIPEEEYEEGDTFELTFTTTEPVEEDLNFTFTLENEDFTEDDYSGQTTVTIPEGEDSSTAEIHIIEDGINDGDEYFMFQFGELPDEYRRISDFIEVRVYDMDFETADFGTPLNPTYGEVEKEIPDGYYDSLDGLAGNDLKQALQDIVANPDEVRVHTYADMIDLLKITDQNPENSNQVWLIYLEEGRAKIDYQLTSNSTDKWNREHTFPRSRGGFEAREGDDIPTGQNVYWTTNADSLRHAFSDAHALRAADGPENSSRSNKHYGWEQYDGPEGTAGSFYGDAARGILYMDIRYNDLEAVEGYPSNTEENLGKLGDLESMLEWHEMDPVDDFEMNRNNIIYEWQRNRNPFIDYPELVDYIWGDKIGEVWHQPDMGVEEQKEMELTFYPNPTRENIVIEGLKNKGEVEIFSMNGRKLYTQKINGDTVLSLNLSAGVYLLKIIATNQNLTKKLIIK